MTSYANGTAFEREVRKHLEDDGYWTIRAAGSHGKCDVLAIKPGQVLVIQAKRNGICPPAERAEVRRIAALLPGIGVPLIASRPRVTFRELTGNGPREHRPWVSDEVGDGSIPSPCADRMGPSHKATPGGGSTPFVRGSDPSMQGEELP